MPIPNEWNTLNNSDWTSPYKEGVIEYGNLNEQKRRMDDGQNPDGDTQQTAFFPKSRYNGFSASYVKCVGVTMTDGRKQHGSTDDYKLITVWICSSDSIFNTKETLPWALDFRHELVMRKLLPLAKGPMRAIHNLGRPSSSSDRYKDEEYEKWTFKPGPLTEDNWDNKPSELIIARKDRHSITTVDIQNLLAFVLDSQEEDRVAPATSAPNLEERYIF